MNPYTMLGSAIGTDEAAMLGARLSAWHDAMVFHERRLRTARASKGCDDECPHAEAGVLWSEAVATFGPRAHELTFLLSRANEAARRSKSGGAGRERMSEAADRVIKTDRTRATRHHRFVSASSDPAPAVAEV